MRTFLIGLVVTLLAYAGGERPSWAANETVPVTVKVFREVTAAPAGQGIQIYVDGVLVGSTAANSTRIVQVRVGSRRIAALDSGLAAAVVTTTLVAGRPATVNILMTGEGLADVVPHTFVPAFGSILPRTGGAFRGRFVNGAGATIKLKTLDLARVTREPSGQEIDLRGRLVVTTLGEIGPAPGANFLDLLSFDGQLVAEIEGISQAGLPLQGSATFYIGRYTLSGRLRSPPSRPGLALGSVSVKISLLGTAISGVVKTKADGTFQAPNMPAGNIQVSASLSQSNKVYSALASFFISRNTSADIPMRGLADVLAGVEPIVLSGASSLGSSEAPAAEDPLRLEADRKAARAAADIAPVQAVPGTVNVSVSSGPVNVRRSSTQKLTVPKGTKRLQLRYRVSTIEYPYYVLSRSIYNDIWDLQVVASKQTLKSLSRNVNAQVSLAPTWQSDGSTGFIDEVFDVSALTTSAAIDVALAASATNIGDSLLPTTVTASLGPASESLATRLVSIVNSTNGPADIMSVPLAGARNTYQKRAILELVAPASVQVSDINQVVVQFLIGPTVGAGPTVFSGTPKPEGGRKFSVPLTYAGAFAAVVSTKPPPADKGRYQIITRARIKGQVQEARTQTGLLGLLWRMPDGFGRYSFREPDGDDWSAQSTYQYLVDRKSQITRINDISAEHGRNIQHKTHKRGGDIDIFQFYSLAISTGEGNYLVLETAAKRAVTGNAQQALAAKATLKAAVDAQRAGLANLLADARVVRLYAGNGRAVSSVLPRDWLEALIKSGNFRGANPSATLVKIDNGATISSKIEFNEIHNSHNHITLAKGAGEGP